MNKNHYPYVLSAIALGALVAAQACSAPNVGTNVNGAGAIAPTGGVTTYHNNLSRDGNYPYETLLTQSNVTAATFGLIGNLTVDGVVYAQPLVAKGVTLSDQSVHDLLIVATEHDSVYAFDVPAGAPTLVNAPVWKRSFTGDSVLACSNCSSLNISQSFLPNISPEVGITATPVIDPSTGVLYVVAETEENGVFHIKLHALDLTSGAELGEGPIEIQGSAPGTGTGALAGSGQIVFDQTTQTLPVQLSRSALTLVPGTEGGNNQVLFGFSSYDDRDPAHGWVFTYDAVTLAQTGTYVTTPNSGLGSVWMAGGGPAVDASGNIYFSTGNRGDDDVVLPDQADAIVKLGFNSNGLTLLDWFAPYDRDALDNADIELGSGALALLPDQATGPYPHLLVQGGKAGTLYLINRDQFISTGSPTHMPPTGATDNLGVIVDELPNVVAPEGTGSTYTGIYSTPTIWKNQVYVAAMQSYLESFGVSGGKFIRSPTGVAPERIAARGASTSISYDSNNPSQGIIWLVDDSAYTTGWNPTTATVSETQGPAVLYAYDPDNLSNGPLYASNMQGNVDNAGLAAKFTVPTIEGGHVFVGTRTLVGSPTCMSASAFPSGVIAAGANTVCTGSGCSFIYKNGTITCPLQNAGQISVYGLMPTRTVPPPNPPANPSPALLSQTGLFLSPVSSLQPASGVVPYDVNSPLWSDAAIKQRWINLPAGSGAGIVFDPTQPWIFPVGTRLIKNFDLALADGTTTHLETRVLTYTSSGWAGVTYQWNAAQTDANLLVDGSLANYTVNDPDNPGSTIIQTWHFPASNQCVTCHNAVIGGALGVNTRQLNKNFAYPAPVGTVNILDYLNSLKMFADGPTVGPASQYDAFANVADPTQTFTARSRSYLNSNCAMCHVPGGPSGTATDFRFDTPLSAMGALSAAPLHGNLGVAGAQIIDPGNAASSLVWLRMDTEGTGRMPPLSTFLIDPVATPVIQSWINGGCTN